MALVRAVAIFCEDIRAERSGQDILIGTMSDNLALPGAPVMLGRLGVYIRAYFDVSSKPEDIGGRIQFPWGQRLELGQADASLVKDALNQAKAQKIPLAGVVLKALFSQLLIESAGVVTAHIKIGKREHLCGVLNLGVDPNLIATALPPPA